MFSFHRRIPMEENTWRAVLVGMQNPCGFFRKDPQAGDTVLSCILLLQKTGWYLFLHSTFQCILLRRKTKICGSWPFVSSTGLYLFWKIILVRTPPKQGFMTACCLHTASQAMFPPVVKIFRVAYGLCIISICTPTASLHFVLFACNNKLLFFCFKSWIIRLSSPSSKLNMSSWSNPSQQIWMAAEHQSQGRVRITCMGGKHFDIFH